VHLQYNVRLASGDLTSGPGAEELHNAERDPVLASTGLLAKLAQRIADANINIRLVSGQGIETGGSVVLAVGVSDETEHHDEEKLERLLDEHGYAWDPLIPTTTLLADEVGALAAWAREIAATGRLIDSIALGTPERSGKASGRVPLQATTILVQQRTASTTPRRASASKRGSTSRRKGR
jgi:hypothetical protein